VSLAIGTDFTGALMLVVPIEREYSVDITTTQWMLNIYALTFAMGLVASGRMSDMFGRRRLLLIGLTIFIIGSLGCALAPSVGLLIGARAVQGIGSSIVWPCVLGIASTAGRKEEQAKNIGLIMGAITTGNIIGPVIGGTLGGLGDWRWFFFVNLALGAVAAVMVLVCLPSDIHKQEDERVDIGGMLMLSIATLSLLYALDAGADLGWRSLPIIALFMLSAVLAAGFPLFENRVSDPMIPLPMLHNRQFLLALLTNGLQVPAVFLLFLYIPQYLHKVLGWPVFKAAIGTLPLMVCLAVISVLSGRLYNRTGPRLLLLIGYSLTVLGSISATLISQAWGYSGLLPAMVLIGLGCGMSIGSAGAAAIDAADPSRVGIAGGLSFMFHLSFGAIGVAGATAILSAVSAVKLRQGLAAMGVKLSVADQMILNGGTPQTEAFRKIVDGLNPQIGDRVIMLVQEAFTTGIHRAYLLALTFTIIGVFVALSLDRAKLVRVNA
jgi:DHA2 family methylenomycin A resistance protein-like MFS transporter